MYKLLLCWRYLWTRYLALASVISVMLGVGTLVVVNSVMAGFSTKLLVKFRGLQSDIFIKHHSLNGFPNLEETMAAVRQKLGPRLQAITPTIDGFALAEYQYDRSPIKNKKPVMIIGIEPATRAATNDFANWLLAPENRKDPANCFELRGKALEDYQQYHSLPQRINLPLTMMPPAVPPDLLRPPAPPRKNDAEVRQAQAEQLPTAPPPSDVPDLPQAKVPGVIVGWGLATVRDPRAHATKEQDKKENPDLIVLHPGDVLRLTLATRDDIVSLDGSSRGPSVHTADFVVTDLFRSDMQDLDRMTVFVDIRTLQQMQVMYNMATSLHLKLANYDRDVDSCLKDLKEIFPMSYFEVRTWVESGAPIFSAIAVERSILNVLLFLIIAVAGFGILAIFFMIVVEKTRDIGILKSLGASNVGVMGIFISYGLLLGIVGSGLGTLGGVAFTLHINEIERFISRMTGQDVFPRDIYFFDTIPVDLNPSMLFWVNFGAITIATAASVFPALRAALLHPVRALRFE
jgi:lipoprotein-releasing system permease protein